MVAKRKFLQIRQVSYFLVNNSSGTLQVSGNAEAYVSTMGGRFTVTNFGDLKPGGDTPLKLTLEVDYFRMVLDGDVLFEIDVEAGKRIIGGVDQLAEIRAAMGI